MDNIRVSIAEMENIENQLQQRTEDSQAKLQETLLTFSIAGAINLALLALVQIIANLLINAMKFVDEGVSPQIKVSAEIRGECVRLWVEDNGIGIYV